jgi:hypothetical protein
MKPEVLQLITAFTSAGSVLVALTATFLGFWYNRKLLNLNLTHNQNIIMQKNQEDEKKEIYKKLNDFYGPFLELRKKSVLLYEQFALKQKKEKEDKGDRFRTLLALLDGEVFIGNDDILLKEIIKIDEKLEKMIVSKAGLIDDKELREKILPRFSTHVLLMRLAYEKKLTGNIDSFKDKTFPSELDEAIERKIDDLINRLVQINSIGNNSYKQLK